MGWQLCLGALLGLPAVAVAQWSPAPAATRPAPPAALREPGGARLSARDGHVFRDVGGVSRQLEETHGAPGEVVAAAMSATGVGYFASAAGLFVTHPSVPTLDRLTFGDVPGEALVGLAVDRTDRVWLATRERLLVLDSGSWFGAEHGVAQGLPAPPFEALACDEAGDLQLFAAVGAFCWRRDEAPPAPVQAMVVGVDAAGVVELAFASSDAAARSWRYRLASHHRLEPVVDGRLRLRRPGTQQLLVYAFDDELDRSAPVSLTVQVPAPPGLDVRTVAVWAALGAVLATALWLWRSRRRGLSVRRGLLDAALFLAIAGQLTMAMTSIGCAYPFIGFTMYGEVYHEHDVLFTPAVVGLAGERQVALRAGALDFATDGVWRHVASLAFEDSAARREVFRGAPREVEAIDVLVRRCRLTPNGPRDVAPFVLARLERPGQGR